MAKNEYTRSADMMNSEPEMRAATGTLPTPPAYITGAFVHSYIEETSAEVQKRFTDTMARTGINIPNTAVPLHSAQIELFNAVI